MAKDVRVLVLRTAGTNCDKETVFAFAQYGATVDCVHVNAVLRRTVAVHEYHIVAIPGGFTYGDDIESGRILANELRLQLGAELLRFVADGKLIIGICNGFQVLVKAGLLPGPLCAAEATRRDMPQRATLVTNDSGKFEDRWVHLKVMAKGVWTNGLGSQVTFPVAHAEGKFIPADPAVLAAMKENGQIAFTYCSSDGSQPLYPADPNGSVDHIAGVTDQTGRILGLMPHPERHFFAYHHPCWTRRDIPPTALGDGAKVFENGVRYAREML